MPDRELDLAEIIDRLKSKKADLEAILEYLPKGARDKPYLEALLDKIDQTILTLIRLDRQASKIISHRLTPTELDEMDQRLAALSRFIPMDQPLQETIAFLGGFVDKIAPILSLAAVAETGAWGEREYIGAGGGATAALPGEPTPGLPRAKPPQPPLKRAPSPRVVNTGFAPAGMPDKKLDPKFPLRCGKKYFFWLEIGPPQKETIEETPVDIPPVPAEAILTVALFGFKGELEITPGADVGELKVQEDLTVGVTCQPLAESPPRSSLLKKRLFFPVAAPAQNGEYRIRCHIYWGQILLQSRIIHVLVWKQHPLIRQGQKSLRSTLDYTLSSTLQPAGITKLKEHRLSVFMNRNGDGTHSFHLFGTDGQERFKHDDIRFPEGELQGMISQTRGTLRLASWGNDKEWQEGIPYKYQDRQLNLDRLTSDLTNMARWGYDFYDKIVNRMAGKEQAVAELEKALLKPGIIQLAMKESPSYVLPAALIYDYPLDTGAQSFSLCNSFAAALKKGQPLEDLECFQGNCPTRGDDTAICPSGFWGFRHYLGMPLSVGDGPDMPPFIPVQQDLHLSMIVATDLQFLDKHSQALRKLRTQMVWNYADRRDEAFKVLKESPHLVYFYCHAGLTRGKPYLQVGSSGQINPSNFRALNIQWEAPRPLVFINGCHTAAVEPLQALEFITPLVTYSHGAGVIGTEITIFEELATVFAEECLRRFFQGESIGAALRGARLSLLQEGNPLGLVYIPFVIASLTLKDQGALALGDLQPPKMTDGKIIDEGDSVVIEGIRLAKHHE
ncbi:MAG: CHAT domain-containing protein [Desulfobaccales bacterium]